MWQALAQADTLGRGVAGLLLAMSVASWVVILWKVWWLRRVRRGLPQAVAAFWQAADLDDAQRRLEGFDATRVALPLLLAARALDDAPAHTLAVAGDRAQQLTRVLRDALHAVLARLQYGQVLLATVGATAPFVGLLGTVWGVYHALTAIGMDEGFRIEQVAGPVGEALAMTAAGLAVAIPAVLAYNVMGRWIATLEADLEGFARDLRELLASQRWSVGA
ncbi:MotA/TolQ/ExbB proton channel family protein [Hydrogenophaga sp.]|uniref:MotA/TolQ/ExbB proton channel family protein n=1 Tax=Hydrogenophaga sp. TaxID=1904254 RepID=UPI0035B1FE2A